MGASNAGARLQEMNNRYLRVILLSDGEPVPKRLETSMKTRMRTIMLFAGVGVAIATMATLGAGLWFLVSHRTSATGSAELADHEFSRLRARFANEQPLLDMSHREARETLHESGRVAPLRLFHTVIFDTRGGQRLVRIDVPYWFARRFAGRDGEFSWLGQLTFLDDTEFDAEVIRLSLNRLERRGPGLVAYYRHPGGGQFISWVE
jgi:hypothetical protein